MLNPGKPMTGGFTWWENCCSLLIYWVFHDIRWIWVPWEKTVRGFMKSETDITLFVKPVALLGALLKHVA